MQMRPEIQIRSMIKALTEVVIPAVSSDNKLAVEQAQLVVGMLKLMQAQIPLQFRFDVDELRRLVDTAGTLGAMEATEDGACVALAGVAQARDRAADILSRCGADPGELHAEIMRMRASLCTLVDACAAGGRTDERARIEAVLLAMSKEQLLRDRVLMKPQAWEPDAAALPDIEALIH
jgi:hypothetical protein